MLIDAHTSDQELINLAIEMGKDMKITVPIVEIPLSFCVYENQPDTARVDFINTDKYRNPVVTRYKDRRIKNELTNPAFSPFRTITTKFI